MSLLAPTLQAFFTERLITQRAASPQTISSYRDTFRLLLAFVQEQTGKQPCEVDFADLDAPLIGAFLEHLEKGRGNSPRTRNARLAAIHSLYRYAALRHPEHAASIARVMAIPSKRYQRNTLYYLTTSEITALLAAPDPNTWLGRRDHALLLTAIQTGIRVSEFTALRVRDVSLSTGAHVRVIGKGRKERCTTLTRGDRHSAQGMAHRARRPARRPALPHPPRTTPHPTHGRPAPHQARSHSSSPLPHPPSQARHPTRPPPHQRDAAPSQGRGHRHNRTLARTREHQDHPHLRTRRPQTQGTSNRAHRPTRSHTRQIPSPRHTPRVSAVAPDGAEQREPFALTPHRMRLVEVRDGHS